VPAVPVLVEVAVLPCPSAAALELAVPFVAFEVEVAVPPFVVTALLLEFAVWSAPETALESAVALTPSPLATAFEVPFVATALVTAAPPFSAFDVAVLVPPFAAA
jgi:hypothetical protein